MELRMYRYRLYPSRKQQARLLKQFSICKEVYNTLLDLNKKLLITQKFHLDSLVKDIKTTCPEYYSQVNGQVLQNISDRLNKSFSHFFRRVKDKSYKEKGFPRFKSKVKSITYPQNGPHGGFKFLSDKRIYASKIGNIPIILHRVPKGKIKTLTIKQNKAGQWHAIFACEVDIPTVKHVSVEKVGVDLGIENFATLSNGQVIENPRYLIKSEKRLKLLQRRLSRKNKGSANRRKARFKLAKQHLKVSNQRTDFLHKLTHNLVKSYSFITIEDLKVSTMLNTYWNKNTLDAGWANFARMLEYKAVTSDSTLIKVDPANTSKTCSKCGTINEALTIADRQFTCPSCGFSAHRDLNASHNILTVGTDSAKHNACGNTIRPSVKASVNETGTTHGK